MSRFGKWVLPTLCLMATFSLVNLGFYLWLAPGMGLVPSSLPFAATFDASTLASWPTFGGDWQSSNQQLVQQNSNQQYVAIFAPIKLPPEQTYRLQAKFQLPPQPSDSSQIPGIPETSAGVVFNVVYPLYQWKSQFAFVRSSNGIFSVTCGYFLEFVPHVQVSFSLPSTPEIVLNVLVSPTGYTLYVNQTLIARDVPLFYRGGGIGLGTFGNGAVFSSLHADAWPPGQTVNLVPTDVPSEIPPTANPSLSVNSAPSPAIGSLKTLQTISGQWEQIGTQYRQEASEPGEYTASTIYSAERYTVSASIVLTQVGNAAAIPGTDREGGFMLNMLNKDSPFGANTVRLKNGGRTVAWGYFNNGEFVSQGQEDVPIPPNPNSTLKVVVQSGAYTIFVNNSPIAAEIPLLNRAGWLGLISDGGPVLFNNFTLTLKG